MSALHENPLYHALVIGSSDEGVRVLNEMLDEKELLPVTSDQLPVIKLAMKIAVSHGIRGLSMSPCDPAAFHQFVKEDTEKNVVDGNLDMPNKLEEHGVALIARERVRQVQVERFSGQHDDTHSDGSLAQAAACYASTAAIQSEKNVTVLPPCFIHKDWPWQRNWWKPSSDPIRNLVKAGALIAAEIDRLLRRRNPADGGSN